MKRGTCVLLLAATAALAAGCTCPRVYLLEGTEGQQNSFDILFVGAGFEKGELDTFRTVADQYADFLVNTPPFSQFSDVINVYRMDVFEYGGLLTCDSGGSVVDGLCSKCPSGECGGKKLPVVPYTGSPKKTKFPFRMRTARRDLGITRCWSEASEPKTDCRISWTGAGGQKTIADLAICAGVGVDAVVVVTNLDWNAGGGSRDPGASAVGIAVVGADVRDVPDQAILTEYAKVLLAHEVGHVLGLHDEYVDIDIDGTFQTTFRQNMNVWRPDAGWIPNSPQPACPAIPWQSRMDCGNGLTLCYNGNKSTVHECPVVHDACPSAFSNLPDASCFCTSNPYSPNPLLRDQPGLWEGAFYKKDDYYRAKDGCWMSELNPSYAYCEGCVTALSRQLCGYRSPPSGCPPPIPELAPGC